MGGILLGWEVKDGEADYKGTATVTKVDEDGTFTVGYDKPLPLELNPAINTKVGIYLEYVGGLKVGDKLKFKLIIIKEESKNGTY